MGGAHLPRTQTLLPTLSKALAGSLLAYSTFLISYCHDVKIEGFESRLLSKLTMQQLERERGRESLLQRGGAGGRGELDSRGSADLNNNISNNNSNNNSHTQASFGTHTHTNTHTHTRRSIGIIDTNDLYVSGGSLAKVLLLPRFVIYVVCAYLYRHHFSPHLA